MIQSVCHILRDAALRDIRDVLLFIQKIKTFNELKSRKHNLSTNNFSIFKILFFIIFILVLSYKLKYMWSDTLHSGA